MYPYLVLKLPRAVRGAEVHTRHRKQASRGSRPFSQGGHWDNWNGSGDLDGKGRGRRADRGERGEKKVGLGKD